MVTVCKTKIFAGNSGASITEVLLAMAIIAVAAPLLYNQISDTNKNIMDISTAQEIIKLRSGVLNFVRINQDAWPADAQIKLDDVDLAEIAADAATGFVDKYSVRGATMTDVYLAFDFGDDTLRVNRIARYIGTDAAVVGDDGVAYGASWAAAAPDFRTGNLIYRITRETVGEDKTKYLHRAASDTDELNVMLRDLNMGGNDVLNVGGLVATSVHARNGTTTFLESDVLMTDALYYSSGAIIDGANAAISNLRVTGDMSGFRNINAGTLNGDGYTTTGHIITDRATISNSVNVANDFVLKSDTVRTVSGFTGMTANSVKTPFLSAQDIVFYENFGLTVSGELMMSTVAPIKIGSWTFPSNNLPTFSELHFTRSEFPSAPNKDEFSAIMDAGWQSVQPQGVVQ